MEKSNLEVTQFPNLCHKFKSNEINKLKITIPELISCWRRAKNLRLKRRLCVCVRVRRGVQQLWLAAQVRGWFNRRRHDGHLCDVAAVGQADFKIVGQI